MGATVARNRHSRVSGNQWLPADNTIIRQYRLGFPLTRE